MQNYAKKATLALFFIGTAGAMQAPKGSRENGGSKKLHTSRSLSLSPSKKVLQDKDINQPLTVQTLSTVKDVKVLKSTFQEQIESIENYPLASLSDISTSMDAIERLDEVRKEAYSFLVATRRSKKVTDAFIKTINPEFESLWNKFFKAYFILLEALVAESLAVKGDFTSLKTEDGPTRRDKVKAELLEAAKLHNAINALEGAQVTSDIKRQSQELISKAFRNLH